ncbi:MAG TPA: putative manganese transporter [Bacteroidales bacterium]|nr:putative manganese transporter [Bacteroidales bacterium]
MIELAKMVLQQTLLVTGFVITMMMLIEYVNVLSRGNWMNRLKKSPVGQVIAGTVLGMIPGCLGTYTAVSLYTHRLLSFGALTAALIATSGDETFMMLALIPREAFIIIFGTGLVAVVTGILIDKFYKKSAKFIQDEYCFTLHENESRPRLFKDLSLKNFRLTWQRMIALLVFGFFIVAPFVGLVEHNHNVMMPSINTTVQTDTHQHTEECEHQEHDGASHEGHAHDGEINWLGISLAVAAALGFIISAASTEHFLKDHIIKHIIKKHFLKVFLWTLFALAAIQLLLHYTDFSHWISANLYLILLLAVLVGIIPESGPHLLFLSLYVSGTIPLSILFANSIVQDGHGALPLFAESKRSFVVAKLINVVVGLLFGVAGLMLGL